MRRDPATGEWHKKWGRGGFWAIYQGGVDQTLEKELRGEPPPNGKSSWQAYWVYECEMLNYAGFGTTYINFIIEQRRQHGLPDIAEINNRTFRTPWQVFTNSYDPVIEREAQGLPPASRYKTWQDYWRSKFEGIRPNKNIGEKGVTYIKKKREELHLPLVAESRRGFFH